MHEDRPTAMLRVARVFGKKLAQLRERKGWTAQEFAGRLAIHPLALEDIETGKVLPREWLQRRIVKTLMENRVYEKRGSVHTLRAKKDYLKRITIPLKRKTYERLHSAAKAMNIPTGVLALALIERALGGDEELATLASAERALRRAWTTEQISQWPLIAAVLTKDLAAFDGPAHRDDPLIPLAKKQIKEPEDVEGPSEALDRVAEEMGIDPIEAFAEYELVDL